MRNRWLILAAAGFLIAATGCDVSDDDSDTTNNGGTDTVGGTDTTGGTDTIGGVDTIGGTDTVTGTQYYAIYLETLLLAPNLGSDGNFRCETSADGSHGPDIDAVELLDPSTTTPTLIGYYEQGKTANNGDPDGTADCGPAPATGNGVAWTTNDPNQATGAPDSNGSDNLWYSLYSGYLIGEFDNAAQVLSGYQVRVHEIDSGAGGVTEKYGVWVAEDIDCVNQTDRGKTNGCMIEITGAQGAGGTATLPLSGF